MSLANIPASLDYGTYSSGDLSVLNARIVSGAAVYPPGATILVGSAYYSVKTQGGQFTAGKSGTTPVRQSQPDGALLNRDGDTVSAGGSGNRVSFLGQIATRCQIADGFTVTGPNGILSRSFHFARDNMTSWAVEYPNWYANSSNANGAETGSGAAIQISVAVEYPLGTTPTPITFGGNLIGSIPNNGDLLSDFVAKTIPFGGKFALRTWIGYTATGLIRTGVSPMVGEGLATAADNTNVYTNAAVTQAATLLIPPTAIVGMTTRPSAFISGDSIAKGDNNAGNVGDPVSGDCGYLARALGPNVGYIKSAIAGESLNLFLTVARAHQVHLAAYCTHHFSQYGINDLRTGARTAAQVLADHITWAAQIGLPYYPATMTPATGGAWTTMAAQTANANEAQIATFNNYVRAGSITGQRGFSEVRRVLQSLVDSAGAVQQDSGFWQILNSGTPGAALTSDGIHPNTTAELMVASSGAVPVAKVI